MWPRCVCPGFGQVHVRRSFSRHISSPITWPADHKVERWSVFRSLTSFTSALLPRLCGWRLDSSWESTRDLQGLDLWPCQQVWQSFRLVPVPWHFPFVSTRWACTNVSLRCGLESLTAVHWNSRRACWQLPCSAAAVHSGKRYFRSHDSLFT